MGRRQVLVGYLAGDHLPHQNAKAIHIRIALILLALEDLRGHPMRSADANVSFALILTCVDSTQAEVAELHVPVFVDQYI